MKSYQVILASLLLCACVDNGYRPVALDSNFGRSVTQITQAQYLDPKAAAHPSTKISKRLDGQAAQNIMKTYRTGFNQPEKVQSVNINVGSNSNLQSSSGN